MTEKEIVAIIGKDRVIAGHQLVCGNVSHLLRGQQDMISVNKAGLLIEYEVKISRSDFQRDARKNKDKTFADLLNWKYIPNQFYYVVPIGLVDAHEVPAWAGLIYVTDKKVMYSKKKAPLLHSYKHDLFKIYKKFATLYQQRFFLGCTLLTYENRAINERNRKLQEQYDLNRQAQQKLIENYKKKKSAQ